MGANKVILLLLVFSFSKAFCFENITAQESNQDLINGDSIYHQNEQQLNKEYVQGVVENLTNIEGSEDSLTNQDLKNLAFSYAYLNDSKKSTEYIKKYIKSVLSVDILEDSSFDSIRSTKEFVALERQYSLRLDGWVIFLFSCGLIGIFLFIVLNLRKKGDFTTNLLISTFVLFHSLFVLHATVFMSRYSYQAPHALYLTTTFSFLYGPLLYFYYRRIYERYKFKVRDLLHLLPSIALVIYLMPIYLLPTDQKLFLMFNRDDTSFVQLATIIITKLISLSIYGYLVFKVYKKVKKKKLDPQIVNWQRNLMILNFAYVFGYLLFVIGRLKIFSSTISIYSQIFLMSFIILYVGYIAYVHPRVFSKKFLFGERTLAKYQKSGLTSGFSIELKEQLLLLFIEEKIYKQSNISLGILAQRLGTTRHNVSQVINEHFELNFFHLVNKYRIEEAKEILKNDYERNLNIIDVAYDVGFNNKVTFNKAFKAETNMTPTVYLQTL